MNVSLASQPTLGKSLAVVPPTAVTVDLHPSMTEREGILEVPGEITQHLGNVANGALDDRFLVVRGKDRRDAERRGARPGRHSHDSNC